MKNILIICVTIISLNVHSQKKIIDNTTYQEWKKIENQIISNDGKFISYFVTPLKGDGFVYIYNTISGKLDSISRAYKPNFTPNSKCLVFKISAGYDTLRKCELNKIEKSKWPKDSLGIYFLANDSLVKIPAVKSFTIPEFGDWIAYTVDSNTLKSGKKTKKHYWIKKNKPVDYKSDGKLFTAFNPMTNKKYQYKDVTDYVVSDSGKYIALTIHQKIKTDSFQLALLETKTGNYFLDKAKRTFISDFTFNKQETKGAFLISADTNENKLIDLAIYDIPTKTWKILVDTNNTAFSKLESVSENRSPNFTEDGSKLYFGVNERPIQEPKDTLLESEKVKLDIWHYKDKRLQPQQLKELKRDVAKNDLYIYHFDSQKYIKLSNDTLTVYPQDKLIGNYLFAVSREQHQGTYNWTSPNLEDHYRVNVITGEISVLKKNVGFGGELSPKGNYYTYFDGEQKNHYIIDLEKNKTTCITCSRKDVNWQFDNNGTPEVAAPLGIMGWFKDENKVLIQSEYDVWSYSLDTKLLSSITLEEGMRTKTKLILNYWTSDSVYVDYSIIYLNGLNDQTKARTIYTLTDHSNHVDMNLVYSTPMEITVLMRSKNKETILIRKMTVKDYPDIHVLDAFFKNEKIASNVNPQQSLYNWATVEMVSWKAYDGTPLQGLLYKPEDYDSTKKYPLLVYYYELYSDEINNYYAPKPTASIIFPTEYASAGYFVFIPDIRYKSGYPAKSAYNCIMSGTDKVLKLYPAIDSLRMGLQGQSWGGYQTAQLITMTTRFKAAMAGAPVSNMFSAYGGIRWGSGLNRQFQYEKQQSRIGKTIWDAPELYFENSPLFHIPNIQTPLLIMANDEDGAVPWYQGIEMFTAMKRLGKPVWMFNYNGDDHNLMKTANRIDLSIRMRQFFDYYLQGKPAPIWLVDGIPAIDKGKKMGYETH
ncbi:MAG: S9 family peptidase [Flavobacteriia bacterium]|nr:S9 family peptidase [Flavobacteriia bacterium]